MDLCHEIFLLERVLARGPPWSPVVCMGTVIGQVQLRCRNSRNGLVCKVVGLTWLKRSSLPSLDRAFMLTALFMIDYSSLVLDYGKELKEGQSSQNLESHT